MNPDLYLAGVEPRGPSSRLITYHQTLDTIRPFGTQVPRTDEFISALLARAEREPMYDPELAYVLSVIAGWSYSDAQTLADKIRYYGLPASTVQPIRVVNPAMLIVASAFFVRSKCGRVGILSFRGTEPDNAINWLTDADVQLRAIAGGKVHGGFYANLQAIWDEICVALEGAVKDGGASNGDGKPRAAMEALYVTGHSLGAAMAALAAAQISAGQSSIPGEMLRAVYTFGQPAVGDAGFAAHCKDLLARKMYRHVFAYDAVPHLPPRSSGTFVHFGEERVSTSPNEAWAPPAEARARQARLLVVAGAVGVASFVARRLHIFRNIPLGYSFDDHSPVRYIEASRAAVG